MRPDAFEKEWILGRFEIFSFYYFHAHVFTVPVVAELLSIIKIQGFMTSWM